MKKTFKFFAAALAIVAAASCAKEINVDTPADTPVDDSAEKVEVTVTASYDTEDDTKTILALDKSIYWSDDDAICVYRYDGSGYLQDVSTLNIDPSSNDENPTFAAFTGTLTYKKGHLYYATFPGEGWDSSYMRFNTGLAKQNAVKDSFDPKKHLALADKAKNDTYDYYVFHNACALLKVTIGLDNAYSVKVEGQNGDMGIGQKVRFSSGSLAVTKLEDTYNSANNAITLSNADGSALENGASYYIVVPHVTVKNFTVSLCDVNGNTLVTKAKNSDFVIERNKIYNLGKFEKEAEVLTVSKSNISLSAAASSDTFTLTTNVNWTISTNVNWLSFDVTSGSPTANQTIKVSAMENTVTSPRSATITVKGENESKTIVVNQAAGEKRYKKVGAVHADQLVSGRKYIIRIVGGSGKYLKNDNNSIVFSSLSNTDSDIPAAYVMEYTYKASNDSKVSNYKAEVVGTLKSVSNNLGLDANLKFSANSSVWLTFANRWGSDTGYDVDIYKNEASQMLYYTRNATVGFASEADAGWNGNNYRKWYIYEVTEQ